MAVIVIKVTVEHIAQLHKDLQLEHLNRKDEQKSLELVGGSCRKSPGSPETHAGRKGNKPTEERKVKGGDERGS